MGQNFKTNLIFGAILPTFSKISCLRCFSMVYRSWIVNYINSYKLNRSICKLCSIRKTFSKRTFSSIQYSKLFISNRSLGKQSSISLVEWVYAFERTFFRQISISYQKNMPVLTRNKNISWATMLYFLSVCPVQKSTKGTFKL